MKKKNKLLGVIVMVVFFSIVACSNDPNDSTWEKANIGQIDGTLSADGKTVNFIFGNSPGVLTNSNGSPGSVVGEWTGTFQGDSVKVTVSGNNWTMQVLESKKYKDYAKGTLSLSGNNITINVTHLMSYGSHGTGGGASEAPVSNPPNSGEETSLPDESIPEEEFL